MTDPDRRDRDGAARTDRDGESAGADRDGESAGADSEDGDGDDGEARPGHGGRDATGNRPEGGRTRPARGRADRGWPGELARTAAVPALAALPWTVVVHPGGYDLLFAWGLLNTNPPHVLTLWRFLFVETAGPASLPGRLLAWPVATVVYLVAVAGVALGVLGGRLGDGGARARRPEARRATAGALAVAGLTHARVTAGLLRIGETALPVGPVVLLAAAWWVYRGGGSRPRSRDRDRGRTRDGDRGRN